MKEVYNKKTKAIEFSGTLLECINYVGFAAHHESLILRDQS